MTNKYFPDERITEDDVFFVCSMIERVARKCGHRNEYVVRKMSDDSIWHYLSLADVLHSENPLKLVDEWIEEFKLRKGSFDITDVRKDLGVTIPAPTQMGAVYKRLVLSLKRDDEDYVKAIRRVYSNKVCRTVDNYNCSAFYEPSYIQRQAFLNGGF